MRGAHSITYPVSNPIVLPLDGCRVEAAAIRALVDNEQNAQFGVIVLVDHGERRA